ncbi:MAG: FAD-dependent oxidoreductase [Rhodospirillales bacterium]
MPLPLNTRIVVIGGGVVGCSIAYHLARIGEKDVVLLEKSGLTHGATWHAAGLIGQLRSSRNLTLMMQYSADLFGKLAQETGVATDWKPVGSLRLASSNARWEEIKRAHGQAKAFGLEMELMSASEAHDLFPYMSKDGVVGAAFIPGDGHIDPSGATQAMAKGARNGGIEIYEGVQVTDLVVTEGRIAEVVTDHGTIGCETVVNAAGLWARQVAAFAGISIPAGIVEHQYMVTDKGLDIAANTPTVRDPDKNFYAKPEVGGFVVGGWEEHTKPLPDGIPFSFGRELFASNFDRFEAIALRAAERVPTLNEIGIQNLINGPIPVSADGEPIMGLAPGIENFYLACGFTAGIAASGGAGWLMANWIVEGDPGMDLWAFDIRRFGPHHANPRYLAERTVEAYSRYYEIHWPAHELKSARGARRSPLYGGLKDQGAVYGSKFGWERPNWFAPVGVERQDKPTFGRANWFEYVGAEHRAVRERVALIDQSSFTKFEVEGPGTLRFLQYLAANDLDKPPGAAIYTQLCNERGGIEADLTIMRIREQAFYIVTGSGFGVRDGQWIISHMPNDGTVVFRDVTSERAVINLCGPESRRVLEKVTADDVSNDGFPYMQCRKVEIGYASVLAIRVTYVGELGWELHMPQEFSSHVYETLRDAGREFGIANVGYRAIDSLRMEKRYLHWSADMSPDYNPYETGLSFCVALDKGDFLGAEMLARIKDEGPKQQLCCFLLDPDAIVYGGEAMLRKGRVLGITTSGNYGHTVGKSIAFGYLPVEEASNQNFEIDCFGRPLPATRCDDVPYDPQRQRILM